jgi:hypothetical protein
MDDTHGPQFCRDFHREPSMLLLPAPTSVAIWRRGAAATMLCARIRLAWAVVATELIVEPAAPEATRRFRPGQAPFAPSAVVLLAARVGSQLQPTDECFYTDLEEPAELIPPRSGAHALELARADLAAAAAVEEATVRRGRKRLSPRKRPPRKADDEPEQPRARRVRLGLLQAASDAECEAAEAKRVWVGLPADATNVDVERLDAMAVAAAARLAAAAPHRIIPGRHSHWNCPPETAVPRLENEAHPLSLPNAVAISLAALGARPGGGGRAGRGGCATFEAVRASPGACSSPGAQPPSSSRYSLIRRRAGHTPQNGRRWIECPAPPGPDRCRDARECGRVPGA